MAQLVVSLISDMETEVGSIEFNGLPIEQTDGSFAFDNHPYSTKCTAYRGIDANELELLVPSIEAALRKRMVIGVCGPYRWMEGKLATIQD